MSPLELRTLISLLSLERNVNVIDDRAPSNKEVVVNDLHERIIQLINNDGGGHYTAIGRPVRVGQIYDQYAPAGMNMLDPHGDQRSLSWEVISLLDNGRVGMQERSYYNKIRMQNVNCEDLEDNDRYWSFVSEAPEVE